MDNSVTFKRIFCSASAKYSHSPLGPGPDFANSSSKSLSWQCGGNQAAASWSNLQPLAIASAVEFPQLHDTSSSEAFASCAWRTRLIKPQSERQIMQVLRTSCRIQGTSNRCRLGWYHGPSNFSRSWGSKSIFGSRLSSLLSSKDCLDILILEWFLSNFLQQLGALLHAVFEFLGIYQRRIAVCSFSVLYRTWSTQMADRIPKFALQQEDLTRSKTMVIALRETRGPRPPHAIANTEEFKYGRWRRSQVRIDLLADTWV